MRTAQELLDLWEKATPENKLILGFEQSDNGMVLNFKEQEVFFKALRERNRPNYQSSLQIARDYEGYTCPITDKWVEGRAAHKENLRQHGCRVFEKGELEEFKKNKPRDVERNAEMLANQLCEKIGQRIGDL